jgi:hypothetical protein
MEAGAWRAEETGRHERQGNTKRHAANQKSMKLEVFLRMVSTDR